jgi:opine dehydrogenase
LTEAAAAASFGSAVAGRRRVGIVGAGAIALASAVWLREAGHEVLLWSPRGMDAGPHGTRTLEAAGLHPCMVTAGFVQDMAALCRDAEVLLLALPVNGHRRVMDQMLPFVLDGQVVIVSSMASLSSLYLYENARHTGRQLTVASLGTTVLTARREAATQVRVMTRRGRIGVSALPGANTAAVLALCTALFGEGFHAQDNALQSALANVNPISLAPLAVYNWTRIERAEPWPQYHCMTPAVARVIETLDAERRALAGACGIEVGSFEEHFARSFGVASSRLADIAAELHAKRGGPPGPTRVDTRFVTEDIPYGLVFLEALGRMADVPMPATRTLVDASSLIGGIDFRRENDLLAPLALERETVAGLRERLR